MRIGSICNKNVVVIKRKSKATEAAQLMKTKNVGCLVVVDNAGTNLIPVGVVTDRDLVLEIMAPEVPANKVLVEDIMNQRTVTVNLDADVYETSQLLKMEGVRRLPVVDDAGHLRGIVSLDDINRLLAEQLMNLSMVMEHEIKNERNIDQLQQRWQ